MHTNRGREKKCSKKEDINQEDLNGNSPKIRTVDLRYYLFRNGGRKKYSNFL